MVNNISIFLVSIIFILFSCENNSKTSCKKISIVKIKNLEFITKKDNIFLKINFENKLEIDTLYVEYGYQPDSNINNKSIFFLGDTILKKSHFLQLKFPPEYLSKSDISNNSSGTILIYSKPLNGTINFKKDTSEKGLYFNFRIRKSKKEFKVIDNLSKESKKSDRLFCYK
jgi:hypothetical protein